MTHSHVHPLFMPLLDALCPLEPTSGPLPPEAAPAQPETYEDMVRRFATSTDDPQSLNLRETAALLAKYPEALWEPLPDAIADLTALLTDEHASTVCIEARVGRLLIERARHYAMTMLQQDVFARREKDKSLDLIESPFSHSEYDVRMSDAGVRERDFA